MSENERAVLTIAVFDDGGRYRVEGIKDVFRVEFKFGEWEYVHYESKTLFTFGLHPRHFLKEVIGKGIYNFPDEVFEKLCEALQGSER